MTQEWLNVADITPRIAYTATAGQTAFPVPFVFFENADLKVYRNGSLLTLGTHYTVAGAEQETGGSVTLTVGATAGDRILIMRVLVIEQTTHIPPSGPLDIPAINIQISKLIAIDQYLRFLIDRSIIVAPEDPTPTTPLPNAAARALKYLIFDSLGNPAVGNPSGLTTPVSTAMAPVVAASTLEIARSALRAADAATTSFVTATRSELKDVDTSAVSTSYLTEAGREGLFIWLAGDYSAQISADPQEGIYIKATAVAVTSGAWERVHTRGFCDVKWFGAKGDGYVTDDTAAIQACINFVGTLYKGTVWISPGGYRITSQLTLSTPLIEVAGPGCKVSSIKATVNNISLFTVTAARCAIRNLSIFQPVLCASQSALIYVGSGAVQCVFECLDLVGGWNCMLFGSGSANNTVRDVVARATNGGQIIDVQGGQFVSIHDCVLDHDWPVVVPNPSQFKGARGNLTAYAVGDVVTASGVYLQCRVAGATGSSIAPLLWYETDIVDGSVRWRLANTVGSCALRADTGAIRVRVVDTDHTGAFDTGIVISNSFGGAKPSEIMVSRCESSGVVFNGVAISAGNRITIENCEFNQPVGNASTQSAVIVSGASVYDVSITNCRAASGFDIGVYLGAGSGFQVMNNRLFCATGVKITGGVSKFSVCDNSTSSVDWGSASSGIVVDAGSSDYYVITGNITGLGSPVSDGGSGTHKTVSANW
ncbi:glycosyl hydrolase family 28-related protein [Tardiphaga sp. 604_B6_N1_1]|uniref:right-handed parallel beta-helix repeat-containing protein n=1 Tax=unclassified Tardiphaga TaxID=2631404 RepID=UPI003F273C04